MQSADSDERKHAPGQHTDRQPLYTLTGAGPVRDCGNLNTKASRLTALKQFRR